MFYDDYVLAADCVYRVSTPELFPTNLRATGHSISSSVARLGAFSSPFVIDNYKISEFAVGLVIGIVNVAAAVAAFMLPETMGKDLDAVTKDKDRIQTVADLKMH